MAIVKLKCVDTGSVTAIKPDELGYSDYQGAADRLIGRAMPHHSADSLAHIDFDNSDVTEFCAEAVRPVGGMTEHSGKSYRFEIIK